MSWAIMTVASACPIEIAATRAVIEAIPSTPISSMANETASPA
jgi:hypothetical protein